MVKRDANGHFVKGSDGGPGRKKRAIEDDYTEILKNCVTKQDWQLIIMKAVSQARRGNPIARKFIADYIVGPPVIRTQGENNTTVTINGFEEMLARVYSE